MRSNRINHNMVLTKDCTLHHVQLYILQNIITIVSHCLFLSVPNLITGMGGGVHRVWYYLCFRHLLTVLEYSHR